MYYNNSMSDKQFRHKQLCTDKQKSKTGDAMRYDSTQSYTVQYCILYTHTACSTCTVYCVYCCVQY